MVLPFPYSTSFRHLALSIKHIFHGGYIMASVIAATRVLGPHYIHLWGT